MELKDYPMAIAQVQRQILALDQGMIGRQETVSILAMEVEKRVIADASLTNDTKRKARRLELQQSDPDYYRASIELKEAQAKREALEIDLGLLRNQFSVLKLTERKAIALLEVQA
jgi:F0F1-type ATP synthase epsilon subunit